MAEFHHRLLLLWTHTPGSFTKADQTRKHFNDSAIDHFFPFRQINTDNSDFKLYLKEGIYQVVISTHFFSNMWFILNVKI